MAIESINSGAASSLAQQSPTHQVDQVQQVEKNQSVESGKVAGATALSEEQDNLSVDKLEAAVEKLNELMNASPRSLAFSVDKDLDEIVVKVVDTETDEVIRQIPSEESLKFAKDLEGVIGVIFNDHV